jgi:SH3-like domain-containing protein|nr:SH3 domain-containing protein [Kofleriaceae bacterium]
MRLGASLAALVVVTAAAAAPAMAEKVKTNQKTKIYAHPGEAGQVLATVKTGQAMTVLSKEGRWLKVRYAGRTGYVPRSKVDLPDDDDAIQRNTRRRPFVDGRGTKRIAGGEGPDDRVGADAVGDGDTGTPSTSKDGGDDVDDGGSKSKGKGSKTVKSTKPKGGGDDGDDGDDAGTKGKGKGKTKGKAKGGGDDGDSGGGDDGDGDSGGGDKPKDGGDSSDGGDGGDTADADTRPRTHVTAKAKVYNDPDKTSDLAFTAEPEQELYIEDKKGKWTEVSLAEGDIGWVQTSKLDLETSGGEGAGITKRTIDLRARVGASFINQGLRTTGSAKLAPPDNYNIGSAAATLAIGADIIYPYGKQYLLGGEMTYDYDAAYPGISFENKTTSISIHQLDLRAVAGYDLHNSKGMVVWGHLGFRYQGYLVANVTNLNDNTALIPSEVFKAPTIGAAITIPRLTPKIGMKANLDLAVIGTSLSQTKNLDDGLAPKEKQVLFGVAGTYRYKPGMDLQATYDLTYGSASFGAVDPTSQRQHMGTSVARTDIFHTIAFGICKTF